MDNGKDNTLTGISFLKKLIGFSTASWLSAAISFFSTPFVTRLFDPSEVGRINLFTTFFIMFQTISILGLDQAFMRFYNDAPKGLSKENLLAYCLKYAIGMATICAIVIFFCGTYFSTQISGESNFLIVICLIVTTFSSVSLRMTSISSRMEKNIFSYTIQVVLVAIVEKVLFVFIAFFKPTHINAIISMTIGYFIIALLFLFIKRKQIRPTNKVPKETSKVILMFAIPYLPVLLLSWLNNSIPQFVLKEFVDYSAIGVYTNAVTIANILSILQTGFNVYWAPFAYENYKKEKDKLQKVHKIISFILIVFSLCIIFSQDAIYLLLGEKFRAGKLIFPFLLFSPICNSIADTTGIGIMLAKKSYYNIITFIANTSTNIMLCYLLIPILGIAGAAVAASISAIVMLIVRTYLGSKFYRLSSNYYHLVLSLLVLFIIATLNLLYIDNYLIKYGANIIAIIIVIIIFKKEFIYLKNFGFSLLKSILKRA